MGQTTVEDNVKFNILITRFRKEEEKVKEKKIVSVKYLGWKFILCLYTSNIYTQ